MKNFFIFVPVAEQWSNTQI